MDDFQDRTVRFLVEMLAQWMKIETGEDATIKVTKFDNAAKIWMDVDFPTPNKKHVRVRVETSG